MLKFIFSPILVLIAVAFMTLFERKILGLIGLRQGPGKVFFMGLFQPFSDAVKLSNKKVYNLSNFSMLYYYLSSMFFLFFCILVWILFSFSPSSFFIKLSFIFLMMLFSFNSITVIVSGWCSFNKYSLMGYVRNLVQMISYEVVLYLIFFFFFLTYFSLNISLFDFYFLKNFYILVIPCFFIWFPSFLGELNRTPLDFIEGESELVSGFNVEYGSSCFTLLFLGEYSMIIFFCYFSSFLFFNQIYFFLFLLVVVWIRSVLPRFRYDKFMMISWKFFIPFLTFYFLLFLILIMMS